MDRAVTRSRGRVRFGLQDLSRLRPRLSLRTLQVGLGLLWLLDGLLQFQPHMYQRGTDGFIGPVTANTIGAPNVLTNFISTTITFMAGHQAMATSGIGAVQVLIGVGLLWRRTVRTALAVSVVWALAVWVIGEGAGLLIFPQASMLTGAPGAALVYGLVALVLWRHKVPGSAEPSAIGTRSPSPESARQVVERGSRSPSPESAGQVVDGGPRSPSAQEAGPLADGGLLGGRGARIAWAVIWCGSSLLELERSNFAPNAISAQLANAAGGEPAPLAWLDRSLAHLTSGAGTELALALLVVEFVVGWSVLRAPTRRFAVWLGVAVSLIYWVVGQNVGTILTGQGTSPNLGLPMVLLALAIVPRAVASGSAPDAAGVPEVAQAVPVESAVSTG